MCAFLQDVASGFLGGLGASLVALGLAYFLVEKRLHLLERRDRVEAEESNRDRIRTAVLRAVLDELTSSAARVQDWLKALPTGGVPFPGFDLTGWPLVSQISAFATLRAETIGALTHAYNRMASANEQHALLSDLNHGPTAILVNSTLAAHVVDGVPPLVQEAFDKFSDHRDFVRKGLIERLHDLKARLDEAIDAVELELGIEGVVPAAQRHFVSDKAPGIIGSS